MERINIGIAYNRCRNISQKCVLMYNYSLSFVSFLKPDENDKQGESFKFKFTFFFFG